MKNKPVLFIFPKKGTVKPVILEILGLKRGDNKLFNPLLTDGKLGVKSKTLWHLIYDNGICEDMQLGEIRSVNVPKELTVKVKRLTRRKPLTIQVKRIR